MSKEKYSRIQKIKRKEFLEFEQKHENKLSKLISRLSSRLQEEINQYTTKGGEIDKRFIDKLEKELDSTAHWYQEQVREMTKEGLVKSSKIAMEGQDKAAKRYVQKLIKKYESRPAVKKLLEKALANPNPMLLSATYGDGLPEKVAQQVWEYRWEDGNDLSDRIWKHGDQMRENLHQMIERSVNEGKSASEITKAVDEYLKKPGPLWTTDIQPAITDGASLKYNALRLARTETNQAYQQTQHISAQNSELVKGVKWNLSASHPTDWPKSAKYRGYPEICDYRAKADHHDLGPGVYPAESSKIPFDHPNGLCYKTDVLKQDDELLDTLDEKFNQ